jgi:hypothetical protein
LHRTKRDFERLQKLPVGWAALILIAVATGGAVVASLRGLDSGTAAFMVVAVVVGAMLGIAGWDLAIGLIATRRGAALVLPYEINFEMPPWLIPFLTPTAFVAGILIGHWFWG